MFFTANRMSKFSLGLIQWSNCSVLHLNKAVKHSIHNIRYSGVELHSVDA